MCNYNYALELYVHELFFFILYMIFIVNARVALWVTRKITSQLTGLYSQDYFILLYIKYIHHLSCSVHVSRVLFIMNPKLEQL